MTSLNKDKDELRSMKEVQYDMTSLNKNEDGSERMLEVQDEITSLSKDKDESDMMKEVQDDMTSLSKDNDGTERMKVLDEMTSMSKNKDGSERMKEVQDDMTSLSKNKDGSERIKEVLDEMTSLSKDKDESEMMKEVQDEVTSLSKDNGGSERVEVLDEMTSMSKYKDGTERMKEVLDGMTSISKNKDGSERMEVQDEMMSMSKNKDGSERMKQVQDEKTSISKNKDGSERMEVLDGMTSMSKNKDGSERMEMIDEMISMSKKKDGTERMKEVLDEMTSMSKNKDGTERMKEVQDEMTSMSKNKDGTERMKEVLDEMTSMSKKKDETERMKEVLDGMTSMSKYKDGTERMKEVLDEMTSMSKYKDGTERMKEVLDEMTSMSKNKDGSERMKEVLDETSLNQIEELEISGSVVPIDTDDIATGSINYSFKKGILTIDLPYLDDVTNVEEMTLKIASDHDDYVPSEIASRSINIDKVPTDPKAKLWKSYDSSDSDEDAIQCSQNYPRKQQARRAKQKTSYNIFEKDKFGDDAECSSNVSGSDYVPETGSSSDDNDVPNQPNQNAILQWTETSSKAQNNTQDCNDTDNSAGSEIEDALIYQSPKEKHSDEAVEQGNGNDASATLDISGDEEEYTPEDVIKDVTFPDIFIVEVTESGMSKAGKIKKNVRVFNSYQYCALCKKKVSNFSQHIYNKRHSENTEIQKIISENDQEKKQTLIALLRYQYNHQSNIQVVNQKRGQILLDRRPTSQFNLKDYGPCPRCLAWMQTRLLWKHQHKCKANRKRETLSTAALVTQSGILSNKLTSSSKLMKTEVFPYMTRDAIGRAAQEDDLIIRLGNQWLEKNIGNRLRRGVYTSQIMRLCSRLLLNLRKLMPQDKSGTLWEYLKPKHFNTLVEATLLTCMPHEDDTGTLESSDQARQVQTPNEAIQVETPNDAEQLQAPSNALKLGFDLKRLINIKIGLCIQQGRPEQREEAQSLLQLMSIFWSTRVTKMAKVILQERHFNKSTNLPNPEDIKKLNVFIKEQLQSIDLDFQHPTYETYTTLVELIEVKLTIYNRRRSGELEAAEKRNYLARRKAGERNTQLMGECTPFEEHLMETQEVMEIRGKTGRGVPVIIPEQVINPLNFISDEDVRMAVGVNKKNPYLFAMVGKDRHRVFQSYSALKTICEKAGLTQPENVTSTSLRKYMATYTQVLDLKENELQWVVNHLGHSVNVHKEYYRATSDEIERTKIAKLLMIQDSGITGKFANKSLDDITFEDLVCVQAEANGGDDSSSNEEVVDPEVFQIAEDFFSLEETEERQTDVKRKFVPAQNRVKWTDNEEDEIKELFKKYFENKSKPSAKAVRLLMKKSKERNGSVHQRTVSALKNKVYRMLRTK